MTSCKCINDQVCKGCQQLDTKRLSRPRFTQAFFTVLNSIGCDGPYQDGICYLARRGEVVMGVYGAPNDAFALLCHLSRTDEDSWVSNILDCLVEEVELDGVEPIEFFCSVISEEDAESFVRKVIAKYFDPEQEKYLEMAELYTLSQAMQD